MPTHVQTAAYDKAVVLAEAGQYQEAFDQIQHYLRESPDDAEALNDAAVLLHCLNRSADGIPYLERAHQVGGNQPEILWNLAETYLAEARADQAKPLFALMEEDEVLSVDLLNQAANVFLNQGQLQDAMDMLNWSLRLAPDQEVLKPMVTVIEHKIKEGGQG